MLARVVVICPHLMDMVARITLLRRLRLCGNAVHAPFSFYQYSASRTAPAQRALSPSLDAHSPAEGAGGYLLSYL